MKIVVEDANVLLDLFHGGVLAIWLGAGHKNCTTHLVWNEVADTRQRKHIQPFIEAKVIELCEVHEEAWPEIAGFAEASGVSIPDSSVWWLAKREKAILLTGDSKLRTAAKRDDVEVRGILWVLDELLAGGQLVPAQAKTALRAMLDHGAFLPPHECDLRLEKWDD